MGGHSAKFPIRHIAWDLDGGWAVTLGQLFRHLCSKLPRRPQVILIGAAGGDGADNGMLRDESGGGNHPEAKGYPAQGQQQNYRSEQDKRATIMMIAARLL